MRTSVEVTRRFFVEKDKVRQTPMNTSYVIHAAACMHVVYHGACIRRLNATPM